MQITTISIDLAKTVFHIHAVDADGATVIRKRLRRAEVFSFVSGLEPCLIGMEACATSHYWARELTKFGQDGEDRLGAARQEGRLSGSDACIRTRLRTRHTIVRFFSLGRVIMA